MKRRCNRAPLAWWCSLEPGHDGPCPAWPHWWSHPILWLEWRTWEVWGL